MKKVKTIEGKPLKRIEGKIHSKSGRLRLRLSRTGGLNAAVHPARGLTFNTKHGVRISKTFRGLTLGIQSGNGIFRGRWSAADGALNTNLSRSGLSLSTSTKHGTYNWTRPKRSSFKFAGIQVRGKKAAAPAMILAIFAIIPALFSVAFQFLQFAGYLIFVGIRVLLWLVATMLQVAVVLWNITMFLIWDLPIQVMNLITGKTILDVTAESDLTSDLQAAATDHDVVHIDSTEYVTVNDREIVDIEPQINNPIEEKKASGLLRALGNWLAVLAGFSCGMTAFTLILLVMDLSYERNLTSDEIILFLGLTFLLSVISYVLIRLGVSRLSLFKTKLKHASDKGRKV